MKAIRDTLYIPSPKPVPYTRANAAPTEAHDDIYCKHDGSLNDGFEIVSHNDNAKLDGGLFVPPLYVSNIVDSSDRIVLLIMFFVE